MSKGLKQSYSSNGSLPNEDWTWTIGLKWTNYYAMVDILSALAIFLKLHAKLNQIMSVNVF